VARRRTSVAPQTPLDVLREHVLLQEKAISAIRQAKMSDVQVVDIENFNDPIESMVCVDWPTGKYCWYHDGEWICVPPDPTHAIKVYGDRAINKVYNGAFRFTIGHNLDNTILVYAEGFNGTVGSGSTTAQVSNQTRGIDMLTTPIVVPSGATSSAVPATINTGGPITNPFNRVEHKDVIWIDVDSVGSGSKGFGCFLTFAPFPDPESLV
jgi:hypothetical protein